MPEQELLYILNLPHGTAHLITRLNQSDQLWWQLHEPKTLLGYRRREVHRWKASSLCRHHERLLCRLWCERWIIEGTTILMRFGLRCHADFAVIRSAEVTLKLVMDQARLQYAVGYQFSEPRGVD